MPRNATDHHEVSVEDLKPFQDKVPDQYGDLEYLIGVNEKGLTYYFTKKGSPVEDSEKQDKVWKAVNEALVGEEAKKEYHYIRIRTRKIGGIVQHEVEDSYCNLFLGTPCPQHTIVIPTDYRSAKAKIAAALAKHPLAPGQLTEVKKLLAKGETLQNEGKYEDSLKMLEQAEAILGIEPDRASENSPAISAYAAS